MKTNDLPNWKKTERKNKKAKLCTKVKRDAERKYNK